MHKYLIFIFLTGPAQARDRWAKIDEARVEWLHACIMHSAKVINLPSHSATMHSNWMNKNERKMTYLFSGDGVDGGSAVALLCLQLSLLLSFASVPAVPFFPLFFPAFSVLAMKNWRRCWLLPSNLGLCFVLCFCSVFFVFHRTFLVFHSFSVLGLFVKTPFLVLFLPPN